MAQFPLEVHSRGMITVSKLLRDAGHEVIMLGNARPEEIVETAIQEDVGAVGISTYCGGEIEQGREVWAGMIDSSCDCQLLIGGIFPDSHAKQLRAMGFQVFTPENSNEDILEALCK
jgi:methylmalonyl-CoA mutase C-terminal domain/subunit